MRLAGLDMAWRPDRNPSGLAVGTLKADTLVLNHWSVAQRNVNELVFELANHKLDGIAVDAPLIINNESGQRACEAELNRVFRSAKAGCHPSNLSLYPDAPSVALANLLRGMGFVHLGKARRFMFECYPHPSMVELFGWLERLLYKRGSVQERKEGQVTLANALLSLQAAKLRLVVAEEMRERLEPDYIRSLKGSGVKDNEDALDALMCLYIAALYATGVEGYCFGDVQNGYVWVPKGQA